MARGNGHTACLSDVRKELVEALHGVKNGSLEEGKARTMTTIARAIIYNTNSITRNSRITAVPLSKGNLDWAA